METEFLPGYKNIIRDEDTYRRDLQRQIALVLEHGGVEELISRLNGAEELVLQNPASIVSLPVFIQTFQDWFDERYPPIPPQPYRRPQFRRWR